MGWLPPAGEDYVSFRRTRSRITHCSVAAPSGKCPMLLCVVYAFGSGSRLLPARPCNIRISMQQECRIKHMIQFGRPSVAPLKKRRCWKPCAPAGSLRARKQKRSSRKSSGRSVRKAYATASATLGFQTLLLALGVGPGWKVCFPAVTFSGMPMQALLTGATVQIVDIDDDGFMVVSDDWVEGQKQMVVPTHLAGAAAPVEAIRTKAKFHRDRRLRASVSGISFRVLRGRRMFEFRL